MKTKTLVIHPEDESTTFLSPIYRKAKSKKVLRKDSNIKEIQDFIKRSERVIMMGHGCPSGLFSVGKFQYSDGLAISAVEVPMLKDKTENIYIWCNADKFVDSWDLKGFYSGMFISETKEAVYCGVKGVTQDMVDESNHTFSKIVGKYIHLPVKNLYEKVIEEYGKLAKTNPVAKYNHERLYYK